MWEIAVHLAVAGGFYYGVFLCFCDLIESVSEGFPTYSYMHMRVDKWQTITEIVIVTLGTSVLDTVVDILFSAVLHYTP